MEHSHALSTVQATGTHMDHIWSGDRSDHASDGGNQLLLEALWGRILVPLQCRFSDLFSPTMARQGTSQGDPDSSQHCSNILTTHRHQFSACLLWTLNKASTHSAALPDLSSTEKLALRVGITILLWLKRGLGLLHKQPGT